MGMYLPFDSIAGYIFINDQLNGAVGAWTEVAGGKVNLSCPDSTPVCLLYSLSFFATIYHLAIVKQ